MQLSDQAKSLSETKATSELSLTDAQQRSQSSADVIVNFISQHLERLKVDGASEQEMAQALSDGFEGFTEGFQEAMQILNDSGLLNDELSAELNDTQTRVGTGLEQLRQQYSPSSDIDFELEDKPKISTATVSGYQSASDSYSSSVLYTNHNNSSVQSQFAAFAESYQQQQLVNLEVLTRDGDKVTIHYEASDSFRRGSSYTQEADVGRASVVAQSQSSSGYAISVEGGLDEVELEALEKLFTQIDDLTETFLDGDFNRAITMAVALQIDGSELASMSLVMQQSISYSVAETYGSMQQMDNSTASRAPSAGLAELGSFVQGILDTLEIADIFDDPIKLLSQLFANRLAQQNWLFPENSYDNKARQLDTLMSQLNEEISV